MSPTWTPVIEKQPDERVTVIIGQDNLQGGTTNFAGWRVGNKWFSYDPQRGLMDHRGMRTTDFWLALPEWPAGCGAMKGGYPA